MKRYLQLILAVFCFFSFGIVNASGNSEWVVYFENENITIEYKKIDCEYIEEFNHEYILFKVTNHLKKEIILDWQQELWYDNQCINCEQFNEEYRKTIKVRANQIITGDCSENTPLRIFSKFTEDLKDMPGVNKITELTKFELKNINIQYE